jgi:hypothetical protein
MAVLAAGAGAAGKPVRMNPITGVQQSSGTVIATDGTSVTIQISGNGSRVIAALTRAADAVTRADYPYVWGGGHAAAGTASKGIRGPGANGRRVGFDCSGAVAAVLASAGLWPAGAGVPSDAGLIAQLRAEGLIVPGAGVGPDEVTLYDEPGVHIFMNIAGRFFGTSDGYGGNPLQRHGGAGWLDDGAPDAYSRAFKPYHFVQRITGNAPAELTLALSSLSGPVTSFLVGDRVSTQWRELASGGIFAQAIQLLGAQQATGSVTAIGDDGQSLVLTTPTGQQITLSASAAGNLSASVQIGDSVAVTYTTQGATLLARGIQITAAAPPVPGTSPTLPGPEPTVPQD